MKYTHLFLVAIFFLSLGKIDAQNIPFPKESDALSRIKSSKSLVNTLKKEYGINSINDLVIKRDDWVGVYENGFSLFYSSEGQKYSWKNPEDKCSVMFRAITKKNNDGIYYDIPITISYTRLTRKNLETYITNKWEYFNWELGSPKVFGAKKVTPEVKRAVVYEALTKVFDSGFDAKKANMTFFLYGLESCIKIDSIYPRSGKEDNILNPKKQSWKLIMKADFASIESGAKMTKLGEGLEINVEITAILVNGKWEANNIAIRLPPYGEKYEGDELYYTYKEIGFKSIYKKRAVKPIPRYSQAYLDIYAKKFKETVKSFTNNEAEDLERLAFFIENGDIEIAKSIRDFYLEMNKKQIEMTNEDYGVSVYWENSKKIRKAYFIFDTRLERASGISDRTLGKEFLAAGMSKKALKKGKFWNNYEQRWVLVFKENRWYITTKMVKDFVVPFY
jgi:hypothetical protein